MTPAATSGVDGVLGGRELEPGAALYLCGPAIAQQKRHRPECGHRLEALGATDYVRIRWYGRAKQQRLAYGARLSHRGTVVQHRACTCALAANFASGGKKDGGPRRYHRYHKDIMSMMSKPPLRHHTKYDSPPRACPAGAGGPGLRLPKTVDRARRNLKPTSRPI